MRTHSQSRRHLAAHFQHVPNRTPHLLADYQFDLFYAFDTSLASPGKIDITASVLASPPPTPETTLVEDSQNLMFGFLAVDNAPFLTAPGGSLCIAVKKPKKATKSIAHEVGRRVSIFPPGANGTVGIREGGR